MIRLFFILSVDTRQLSAVEALERFYSRYDFSVSFALCFYSSHLNFWGAKGAPILFSEIGFCMASCSYIYIYIYNMYIIYIYI